ncbi:MAG: stalk domain-containing protein, partial [Caldisericia bacterium]|nr:stalk domain-containing protein [Caldisericia bacterium]
PLQKGGSIMLDGDEYYPKSVFENGVYGPQLETSIYGNLYTCDDDPKARETIITYSPTGTGKDHAYLQYWNKNTRFEYPNFYMAGGLTKLDIAKGIEITVMSDKNISSEQTSKVVLYVKEAGTNATIPGAKVTIEGLGVKDSKTSDSEGKVDFTILPESQGILVIHATMEGLIDGYTVIGVDKKTTTSSLSLNPVITNPAEETATISGSVEPGSIVTVNEKPATVNAKGDFSYTAKLVAMRNVFEISSVDSYGNKERRVLNIDKQDAQLRIDLMLHDQYIEEKTIDVNGKVTRNSDGVETDRLIWVFVNGIEAKVVADDAATTFDFEAQIPVEVGKNRIEVNVRTNDGFAKKVVEIPNYKRRYVQLQIGNKTATVNEESVELDASPYIKEGRTFVPLSVIAKGFGADVEWVAQTKGINIRLDNTIISMQIGSNRAIVNNQVVPLDAPPEITNGRTFVPIRFVVETLGAELTWNQDDKSIHIERLSLK